MIQQLVRDFIRLFAWLVVVAPWEQALRIRGGKRVQQLGAGMHLRIPFVDVVHRQPIRRRISMTPPQTLTCASGQTITLSGALGYEIADLRRLYETLHDAQDTIEAEVSGVISEYVARHSVHDCTPAQIEAHVTQALQLSRYGLDRPEFFLMNFAIVRTYRLIQGQMRDWQRGDGLRTDLPQPGITA